MKINNIIKNIDWSLWLALMVFAALTFWGVLYHEAWCDEAQAWLIVRDLNLWAVIKQLPYEGTPGLWHLLLFPLAKLGFPFAAQAWLHWLIAIITIYIFLIYAPLPKFIKIITIFSYYPLYEYAVIARNYNLAIMLLFLAAAFYKQRFKKPMIYSLIISFLFQTNLLVFPVALSLLVLFVWENLKDHINEIKPINRANFIMATTIMTISACLVFLQIMPYPGQLHSGLTKPEISTVFHSLSAVFLPLAGSYGQPLIINWLFGITSVATIIIMGLLLFFLVRNKIAVIIYFASTLWLLFIFLFKVRGALRHYGFLFILFLFVWWLSLIINTEKQSDLKLEISKIKKEKYPNNYTNIILTLILLPSIIIAGIAYVKEYRFNFSGSREMAKYLINNQLEQANIASFSSFINISLLPYLPETKFWQPERQVDGTFVTLDLKYTLGNQDTYLVIKNKILNHFKNQDFFILSGVDLLSVDPSLRLIKQTQAPAIIDGVFYLYEIKK